MSKILIHIYSSNGKPITKICNTVLKSTSINCLGFNALKLDNLSVRYYLSLSLLGRKFSNEMMQNIWVWFSFECLISMFPSLGLKV